MAPRWPGGVDADGELLAFPGRIGLALVGRIEGSLGGLGLVLIDGGEAHDDLRSRCRFRGCGDLNLDLRLDDLGLDDRFLDDLGDDLLDDLLFLDHLRRRDGAGGESVAKMATTLTSVTTRFIGCPP